MTLKESMRSRYSDPGMRAFAAEVIGEVRGIFAKAELCRGLQDGKSSKNKLYGLFDSFERRTRGNGDLLTRFRSLFGDDNALFVSQRNGKSLFGFIKSRFGQYVDCDARIPRFPTYDADIFIHIWLREIGFLFSRNRKVEEFQAYVAAVVILRRHFDLFAVDNFPDILSDFTYNIDKADFGTYVEPYVIETEGRRRISAGNRFSRYDCKSSEVTYDECVESLIAYPKMEAYRRVAERHGISAAQARKIFRRFGLTGAKYTANDNQDTQQ